MNKARYVTSLILLISFFVHAQERPLVISAQWLKQHVDDPNLVILQVSFLKYDYEKEHIPGSRFLWTGWLAPDSPEGSFNAPDPNAAAAKLQELGVSNNSHVVLVHLRSEVSPTARMFLTLEHFGLKGQVSFLNGGLEAWKKEGYPVSSEVPKISKGNFKARPGSLLVDKNYVLKTMQSDGIIIDARMKNYYDGEPVGYPRDGHIKGAKNIPYTEMVDQSNMFKPADQLQSYFAPIAGKDKELVTYCFIGQTASVVYMAGRILGYDIKLYDGSMQEWSRIDSLPMEKTEH